LNRDRTKQGIAAKAIAERRRTEFGRESRANRQQILVVHSI